MAEMGVGKIWEAQLAKEQAEEAFRESHAPRYMSIDVSAMFRAPEELQPAASALIGSLHQLQSQLDALGRTINAAEVVGLKKLHKLAWSAARKAKDELKSTAEPIAHAGNNERENNFEWNREFAKLTTINSGIPSAADYPTQEEMEAHWERVDKQKERLQLVETRWNNYKSHLAQLQGEQNDKRIAFDKAKAEVDNLQAKIDRLEGKQPAKSSVKLPNSLGFHTA